MPSVDEATKIVHSTQPQIHRGDDANLVHNPTGGTAAFSHGVNANPSGATAEFSHGVVDTNPLGDGGGGGLGPNEQRNPSGGKAPISPGVNANPQGGRAPFSHGVVQPPSAG